jgi:hypothetical protein
MSGSVTAMSIAQPGFPCLLPFKTPAYQPKVCSEGVDRVTEPANYWFQRTANRAHILHNFAAE